MFFFVSDISELRQSWAETPLALHLKKPEFKELFKSLVSSAQDDEEDDFTEVLNKEFNLTWEDLGKLFPGQFGLTVHNLSEVLLGHDKVIDLAILAEFSGSAERLNELMLIQFERNARAQKEVSPLFEHEMVEELFMGETLYFDEVFDGEKTYVEDGYALVDGVFILATSEERMRSIVEGIKEGTDEPLAKTEGYWRVREGSALGDISFYLNLEAMLPPLNEALQKPQVTNGLAMFGITGRSLELALALESMLGFGADLSFKGEAVSLSSGLIFREKAGLLRLMTYDGGGLSEATYVPDTVLSSSVSTFDLSAMFAELEALFGTASPTIRPIFNMQLQSIKAQTEVDLRPAVLENFGPEVVTLAIVPEAKSGPEGFLQPEQLFVFSIKDAGALSAALEALKDQIPEMRARMKVIEFLGETIHLFKTSPDPNLPDAPIQDVSYVITKSHLLVSLGRVGLLQEVLASMQESGEGFWQQDQIRDVFRKIARPGAVTRSYLNLSKMFETSRQKFLSLSEVSGMSAEIDLPESMEFPYQVISEMNEEEDAFFARSVLLPVEDAK